MCVLEGKRESVRAYVCVLCVRENEKQRVGKRESVRVYVCVFVC